MSVPAELAWIFFTALVVNNFTLSYFLGLCPFFGVSSKVSTALRMGLANIFVMLITAIAAWALQSFVLPYAPYLQTISFIVVIASTVQFVEMFIKKMSPALFRALGIFLPLITTNCAILGLAIFSVSKGYFVPFTGDWVLSLMGLLKGLFFALGAGGGVTLALVLMAGLREDMELAHTPSFAKGAAINFIVAGILSMAFMGFAGLFSGA